MSNKIRFSANPETNYVFHMLSVARCGYDNEYGRKWRGHYAPEDLQILKDQAIHLTVLGGEHCGDWYGPMVCTPAQGRTTAKDYYREMLNWIQDGHLDLPPEDLEANCDICRVMIKYYDDYMTQIWPEEKKQIEAYFLPLQKEFEENGFSEKAEKLVGVALPAPYFIGEVVSSLQGGANAIDISATQDVFNVGTDAVCIAHEFIIFLLKLALKGTDAFRMENWAQTEELADSYLRQLWPAVHLPETST